MKLVFEFRNPRSPYWPAMKYHAQRKKRYKRRVDGVETITWDSSERQAAYLMYQHVKGWSCAHLHIEREDGSSYPPSRGLLQRFPL